MLLCVAVVGCAGPQSATAPSSGPAADVTGAPTADRECAEQTLRGLASAVNDRDEGELARRLAETVSLTLPGRRAFNRQEAVAALVERAHADERWTFVSIDTNGRGWHGGIDIGVLLRRSGPSLPAPYIESPGKGVLDCPDGRVRILGIGDPLPPKSTRR